MATKRDDAQEKAKRKRYSFSRAVDEEADGEWRKLFLYVQRRRQALKDPKRRKVVFSDVEKEGQSSLVVRRQSTPQPLRSYMKKDAKRSGPVLDIELIETLWKHAVGPDIASESSMHSFKNGVLTINIHSSPLLQEIRQFHHEAITHDLRDIWSLPIPLASVKYRQGKR